MSLIHNFDLELIKLYHSIELFKQEKEKKLHIDELNQQLHIFKNNLLKSKFSESSIFKDQLENIDLLIEENLRKNTNFNHNFYEEYTYIIKNSNKDIFDMMIHIPSHNNTTQYDYFNNFQKQLLNEISCKIIQDSSETIIFLKSSDYKKFYSIIGEHKISNFSLSFKLAIPFEEFNPYNSKEDFKGIDREEDSINIKKNNNGFICFPISPEFIVNDFNQNLEKYNIEPVYNQVMLNLGLITNYDRNIYFSDIEYETNRIDEDPEIQYERTYLDENHIENEEFESDFSFQNHEENKIDNLEKEPNSTENTDYNLKQNKNNDIQILKNIEKYDYSKLNISDFSYHKQNNELFLYSYEHIKCSEQKINDLYSLEEFSYELNELYKNILSYSKNSIHTYDSSTKDIYFDQDSNEILSFLNNKSEILNKEELNYTSKQKLVEKYFQLIEQSPNLIFDIFIVKNNSNSIFNIFIPKIKKFISDNDGQYLEANKFIMLKSTDLSKFLNQSNYNYNDIMLKFIPPIPFKDSVELIGHQSLSINGINTNTNTNIFKNIKNLTDTIVLNNIHPLIENIVKEFIDKSLSYDLSFEENMKPQTKKIKHK